MVVTMAGIYTEAHLKPDPVEIFLLLLFLSFFFFFLILYLCDYRFPVSLDSHKHFIALAF